MIMSVGHFYNFVEFINNNTLETFFISTYYLRSKFIKYIVIDVETLFSFPRFKNIRNFDVNGNIGTCMFPCYLLAND